jgi:putative membrane-bound dehydrogenase-like protein
MTRIRRAQPCRICLPAVSILFLIAGTAIVPAPTGLAWAAENPKPDAEADFSSELPRIPPREPKEALQLFEVAPGFMIQLVAAEPLVTDPVAACFDAEGRLYVVEMRDYSEQDQEHLGQIRVLEDTDQDGRFDRSTVFADGLSWPTAIFPFDGGVFVAAAPDFFYLKDQDGDLRSDEKRTVFTGFSRSNVQGLVNSLRWGLDNRIHGCGAGEGGKVVAANTPDAEGVSLRGRDFSFDPRKLDLRAESGGGQHGMSFDDWGRKFACANSQHAQFITYDDQYLKRNPQLAAPGPRVEIADDGGQAPVYRASPVEPWRIVRTRLRVSGAVKGVVEGGGRPAGYFTGATGITIYRGDAIEAMRGMMVVGDVGSNLVHRKRLTPNGISFIASRIDPESEFVRSSDIWFRPVQFHNAPDGSLYILDMYREVIEHPKSLPPVIKQHLDLTSGRDRGRLYRVAPLEWTYRPTPLVNNMSSAELVVLLSHKNAWHRETASRLLFERQDHSIIPELKELAGHGEQPLGRLHALSVLQGLGELDAATVAAAISDPHPRIREQAVRLAEAFPDSTEIQQALGKRTADDDLRVRYQLAFTAGEFPQALRDRWLISILSKDGGDKWICMAAASSLGTNSLPVLQGLFADSGFRQIAAKSPIVPQLIRQIAAEPGEEGTLALLQTLRSLPANENAVRRTLLAGLFDALRQQRKPLNKEARAAYDNLLEESRQALDDAAPKDERIAAIQALRLSDEPEDCQRLLQLIQPETDTAVQSAALAALGRMTSPQVAPGLLERWPQLTPSLRLQGEEVLFSRPDWIVATLDAVEGGQTAATSFSPMRWQLLRKSKDNQLRARVEALVRASGSESRGEVVSRYAEAPEMAGDPARGKILFQKTCAACHRLEGVGHELGPNLATIRNRGKQTIVLNMLDPNREVNPEYLNYIVALKDGRTQTGMIRGETSTSLTLIRAENQATSLLRSDIEEIRSTGQSLMPEGMEKQIDLQGMADLLAYLMSLP